MDPHLFAVVDAVINDARKHAWVLRAWPRCRAKWKDSRAMLGWWRSTWGGR